MEVKCENCNKLFSKKKAEITRSKRHFCCLSCSVTWNNRNTKRVGGQKTFIVKYASNKKDDYTHFRFFKKCSKNSNRKESKITLKDLKDCWNKQDGICPYTGIKLILPISTKGFDPVVSKIYRASLDRIDSSKPYEVGNIQFVSTMANYAKNNCSHEEMIKFCKVIAGNWK